MFLRRQVRELQPQCVLTMQRAAKHIHGGRQNQRTELFRGFITEMDVTPHRLPPSLPSSALAC